MNISAKSLVEVGSDSIASSHEALHHSYGGAGVFHFCLWFIGLLFIAMILLYFRRRLFYLIYPYYVKILIKMGKTIYIISDLRDLIRKEDYSKALKRIEIVIQEPDLPEDIRKQFIDIKKDATQGKQRKKIERKIDQAMEYVKKRDYTSAQNKLNDANEMMTSYEEKGRNKLEERIKDIESIIIKEQVDNALSNIKDNITNDRLDDAMSIFNQLRQKFDIKDLSAVDTFFREYITNKISTAYISKDIDALYSATAFILQSDYYSKLEMAEDSRSKLFELIKNKFGEFFSCYDIESAKSLLESSDSVLLNAQKRDLLGMIKEQEDSMDLIVSGLVQEALKEANNHRYEMAYEKVEKAEKISGRKYNKERKQIDEIKEADEIIQQKKELEQILQKIDSCLSSYNIAEAIKLKEEAISNLKIEEDQIKQIDEKISAAQTQLDLENGYKVAQPLCLVGWFNEPKKKDAGEDADPYFNVNPNQCWGVISAFDGMGGAGARKYIHSQTQEEHTSAYWASRYVRDAVEDMMANRPIGTNPIEYLENNLHSVISKKLNDEIVNFPSASSTMSKMIRKLPTTMAMCAYFITDGVININCYWAGDSRVYLFDCDKMAFLTIDDADAPDNDPFSPANMDLAMNNAICQDREFRINKSSYRVSLDSLKPILIMATSDGCFGYFKNPIEFEYMIRKQLADSKSWEDWCSRIRQAIIDNIQQDDFSMAMVSLGLGVNEFDTLQKLMVKHLDSDIFRNYFEWKTSVLDKQKTLRDEISQLNESIEERNAEKESYSSKKNGIKAVLEDLLPILKKKIDEIGSKENVEIAINTITQELQKENSNCSQKDIDLNSNIEERRKRLTILKEELDSQQLAVEEANNKWYEKYKEYVEIIEVEPSNTI